MNPFCSLRLMLIGILQAAALVACGKTKPPPPQFEIHHHELFILLTSPKEEES